MRSEISVTEAAIIQRATIFLTCLPPSLASLDHHDEAVLVAVSYKILPRPVKVSEPRSLGYILISHGCRARLSSLILRDRQEEGTMLRRAAPALRPSLFVFLASQDAKPKRRRGHQRLFPPLLRSPPPSRIARISGIFPPPTPPPPRRRSTATITGVDNERRHGGWSTFGFRWRPFSTSHPAR